MEIAPEPKVVMPKRPVHRHAFLTHFPISFFVAAFTFQILHLFVRPECFEIATNISLIAATALLAPTIWTGWSEWKTNYRSAKGLIFKRKIRTAIGMAALSLPMIVWRIGTLGLFSEAPQKLAHWSYLAGTTLLIFGASVEGYNGGRLNHR